MKKTLLSIAFLFPLFLSAQYFEPMRGKYVPPTSKKQQQYETNRTIATGIFGFMGGVIRDDSERARMVKWGIFVGTTVSIGWGKKRTKKAVWRDLGAGIVGVAIGSALKSSLMKLE